MADPTGRAAIQGAFDALLHQLFTPESPEAQSSSGDDAAAAIENGTVSAFLLDMPVGKLVPFGVLSEAELARFLAEVRLPA